MIPTATIGTWSATREFHVERDRTVAYAEATNDPLKHHLDGRMAPPVFAVVPAFETMAETTLAAVPEEAVNKILHGQHDLHITRPIVPGDALRCRARVVGVHGRSSGTAVTTLLETTDSNGAEVNRQYFTAFFRGLANGDDMGEPAPDHRMADADRAVPPMFTTVQAFDADQTVRYAAASGDFMPIHLDDEFARKVGLPGIIVHGLCTMAFASHAVISQVFPHDPARLRRLAVRFSAPALPSHTISTSTWRTDAGSYSFETVASDGSRVITDGRAEFSS